MVDNRLPIRSIRTESPTNPRIVLSGAPIGATMSVIRRPSENLACTEDTIGWSEAAASSSQELAPKSLPTNSGFVGIGPDKAPAATADNVPSMFRAESQAE